MRAKSAYKVIMVHSIKKNVFFVYGISVSSRISFNVSNTTVWLKVLSSFPC